MGFLVITSIVIFILWIVVKLFSELFKNGFWWVVIIFFIYLSLLIFVAFK